jgi:DnaT-like ssDNA binding protein
MAFVVETGVALPDANSYCSVEFADSFNRMQIDGQNWEYLDLTDKQIRLSTASRLIDGSFDFHGRRISPFQPLEFPRYGLRNRDGFIIPAAPLPNFLKCATAELARILGERVDAGGSATGVSAPSTTSGGVEKIQVGPIALTLSSQSSTTTSGGGTTATTAPPPLVPRSVVAWLLDYSIPRFGYGSAKLVR